MKSSILVFFLISFSFYNDAQTVFIADSGDVTFYSHAMIEDIKATSTQVNSIYNSVTGEIAFIIPMRSFHFAKALMQEHFNEKYLETDKFPQATFKGKVNEDLDFSKDGIYKLSAKGKMNIHGIEKEIVESGVMEVASGKKTFTTDFYLALEDYNIKKPQLLFNNIADTINVKLKVNYVPYKKK